MKQKLMERKEEIDKSIIIEIVTYPVSTRGLQKNREGERDREREVYFKKLTHDCGSSQV